MCHVSRAIAPHLPWLADRSGGYWRRPPAPVLYAYWPRPPIDDPDEEVLLFLDDFGYALAEPQSAVKAVPCRAPPKERSLSTGMTSHNPTARVNRLTSPDFALQS